MNKQRFENCWSVPQIQRLAISILNRKPALASCGQPFPPVSQCSAWTSQSQTIYLSQHQPSIAYVLAFDKEVNRAILFCCDKPLMTPFRFNQFLVGDHRKNSKRAPSRPHQVLRTSIRRDQGQFRNYSPDWSWTFKFETWDLYTQISECSITSQRNENRKRYARPQPWSFMSIIAPRQKTEFFFRIDKGQVNRGTRLPYPGAQSFRFSLNSEVAQHPLENHKQQVPTGSKNRPNKAFPLWIRFQNKTHFVNVSVRLWWNENWPTLPRSQDSTTNSIGQHFLGSRAW